MTCGGATTRMTTNVSKLELWNDETSTAETTHHHILPSFSLTLCENGNRAIINEFYFVFKLQFSAEKFQYSFLFAGKKYIHAWKNLMRNWFSKIVL